MIFSLQIFADAARPFSLLPALPAPFARLFLSAICYARLFFCRLFSLRAFSLPRAMPLRRHAYAAARCRHCAAPPPLPQRCFTLFELFAADISPPLIDASSDLLHAIAYFR
jgi:hypothetical protein